MTESKIQTALLQTLREELPEAVIFKHADQITAGIPDFSITLGGKTSWWELKHAAPSLLGTQLQLLTMRKLAGTGLAFYLVFTPQDVRIMHPKSVDYRTWRDNVCVLRTDKPYVYPPIATFIRYIHGV